MHNRTKWFLCLRRDNAIMDETTMAGENEFTRRCLRVIKAIPKGKVAAYGQIAAYAGNPLGARQVVRILCAMTTKHGLPWHRVVNREGRIALKDNAGRSAQRRLLEKEGILIGRTGKIDMGRYQWRPRKIRD